MKQKKPTHRELEAEKIAIEKQAKVMWNGMTTIDFDAYVQKVQEERRLNWAENQDLTEQIKEYCDRKPQQKKPDVVNTGFPTLLTGLAGALVARILLENGAFEPTYMASDINDLIGITFAGLGAGGIAGLINSWGYCTKPITKAIVDRQIAKRQAKIDKNNRRNNAITYLEECLKKEEAVIDDSMNDELEGQLHLDLEDDMPVGHA